MFSLILLLLLLVFILGIWVTVSLLGLIVTLVIAGLVGGLASRFIPVKLPYGFLGAIVAGLLGSWLGGWLLGDVGPAIGDVAIGPAFVGSLLVALIATVVLKNRRL